MKNILEEIRSFFVESKTWLQLEVEYAKLTMVEKMTVLATMMIIGLVCLLLGFVVLILLAFCIAEVWKLLMEPWLAYLATAGVVLFLLLLVWLLRKPLLMNPISRAISKVFFDNNHQA